MRWHVILVVNYLLQFLAFFSQNDLYTVDLFSWSHHGNPTNLKSNGPFGSPFGEGFGYWPLFHQNRLRLTFEYTIHFSSIEISNSSQSNLQLSSSRLWHTLTRACLLDSVSSPGIHRPSLLTLPKAVDGRDTENAKLYRKSTCSLHWIIFNDLRYASSTSPQHLGTTWFMFESDLNRQIQSAGTNKYNK